MRRYKYKPLISDCIDSNSTSFFSQVQLSASPTPSPSAPPPSTNSCWERALFLECASESFNYANANDMAYINSDGEEIVNRLVPVVPNNYDILQFNEARFTCTEPGVTSYCATNRPMRNMITPQVGIIKNIRFLHTPTLF